MKDVLRQWMPRSLEEQIQAGMWCILVATVLGIGLLLNAIAHTNHSPCGCLQAPNENPLSPSERIQADWARETG